MTHTFDELYLHPELVQTVTRMGYEAPTPIQAEVIPVMLNRQDVIGQAQTGTGKTAAFSLPIIQNLSTEKRFVQCLVVTPTRELAIQTADAMTAYGRHLGIQALPVYGGQSYSHQISRLKKGVAMVVGTPGRLLDLIHRKVMDLSRVSTVVLDEADEMLSMGFIEDIETILKSTPEGRQTALFSATLPKEIRRVAADYMKTPRSISTGCSRLTVSGTEQRYYMVREKDKVAALCRLFEKEDATRTLIFTRTRVSTGELVNALSTRGYAAEALNGDLSQDSREQVMGRFRNHQIRIMVATDVAARGLDIDDISHVVNFDLPQDPEVYVHRIGRTGRAGKTGVAISLVTPNERWRINRFEKYTKQKLSECVLPTVEEIQGHRDSQMLDKMRVWLRRDRCQLEKEIVAQLVDDGHDPVHIAATALKLARRQENKKPVEAISTIKVEDMAHRPCPAPKPGRKNMPMEKGMVRLALNTGRLSNLKVNQIVGSLSRHTDIPGKCLGKVSIRKHYALVDVPEAFVGQVLAKKDGYRIGRQPIRVDRA